MMQTHPPRAQEAARKFGQEPEQSLPAANAGASGAVTAAPLSVIVVAFNGAAVLARCLEALVPQSEATAGEVVVVGSALDEPGYRALRAAHPQVRWLAAPDEATVPQMRQLALAQCRGAVVAMLEDTSLVADGWCEAALRAHRSAHLAIGGPIEPADYSRARDWAVFFCEYARFMPPFAGAVAALPGNNAAYKQVALAGSAAGHGFYHGFYDVFVHWRWQQQGITLIADPAMLIHHAGGWTPAHLTTSPFHHGRAFAGLRFGPQAYHLRWLYAGLALALPLVQTARVARAVAARRRYRVKLIGALPWMLLFTTCWAAGEITGYLAGAGQSAARWR